jgi:hypothetical protein
MNELPETDWKVFRELRQVALERFCQRAIEDLDRVLRDGSQTFHQRYRDAFQLLETRDRVLAKMFDDPRRSRMIIQLAEICVHHLLQRDEFGRFSVKTRATIEALLERDAI